MFFCLHVHVHALPPWGTLSSFINYLSNLLSVVWLVTRSAWQHWPSDVGIRYVPNALLVSIDNVIKFTKRTTPFGKGNCYSNTYSVNAALNL